MKRGPPRSTWTKPALSSVHAQYVAPMDQFLAQMSALAREASSGAPGAGRREALVALARMCVEERDRLLADGIGGSDALQRIAFLGRVLRRNGFELSECPRMWDPVLVPKTAHTTRAAFLTMRVMQSRVDGCQRAIETLWLAWRFRKSDNPALGMVPRDVMRIIVAVAIRAQFVDRATALQWWKAGVPRGPCRVCCKRSLNPVQCALCGALFHVACLGVADGKRAQLDEIPYCCAPCTRRLQSESPDTVRGDQVVRTTVLREVRNPWALGV